jgi:cell wall-associated NlpC family hydrolase
MLKRIIITGALMLSVVVSMTIMGITSARADTGYANNIVPTALASADTGEVPLSSAKEAQPKIILDSYTVKTIGSRKTHHKIDWTPRKQALWQIEHSYRKQHKWYPKWQFRYLNWLWDRESAWQRFATNPDSGAFGIAQSLGHGQYDTEACGRNEYGGFSLSTAEAQRANCGSASSQIKWGLRYILDVYGTPKAAWNHEVTYGWYISAAHWALVKFNGRMVVEMARTYMGCPSVTGGTGPCDSGFDCSGLVYRVFNNLGQTNIPRTSEEMYTYSHRIKHIIPGDLVFYVGEGYPSPGHVAIYIGHGKVIQANVGPSVGIYSIGYAGQIVGYGRIYYNWNPDTKF